MQSNSPSFVPLEQGRVKEQKHKLPSCFLCLQMWEVILRLGFQFCFEASVILQLRELYIF